MEWLLITAASWVTAPGFTQGAPTQPRGVSPLMKGRWSLSQCPWEPPVCTRGWGTAVSSRSLCRKAPSRSHLHVTRHVLQGLRQWSPGWLLFPAPQGYRQKHSGFG